MFLHPAGEPLLFPLPSGISRSYRSAMLPGVCELVHYMPTKDQSNKSTSRSVLDTRFHPQDNIITVKVLKSKTNRLLDSQHIYEQNPLHEAYRWTSENQNLKDIPNDHIVQYYGGDTRFLALHMEHVDAADLSAIERWRNRRSHNFLGTQQDALQILKDIAAALDHVYGEQLVHNDV